MRAYLRMSAKHARAYARKGGFQVGNKFFSKKRKKLENNFKKCLTLSVVNGIMFKLSCGKTHSGALC